MKKESFSTTVKEHIKANPIKKKCCNHAFSDGCGIFEGKDTPATLIRKASSKLVCSDCMAHFLAGLFVACGNISDPTKSYHMEFSVKETETADVIGEFLDNAGFNSSRTVRKGRHILYFKNSVIIEDLLGYMGASFGAFEVMNAKIVRELREDTNRQVNCDSANIVKSIGAAEQHIKVINELTEMGTISLLPKDLKETAELRLQNPNATLSELGQMFSSPISKSGVKHRLDRLIDFYNSEIAKKNSSNK